MEVSVLPLVGNIDIVSINEFGIRASINKDNTIEDPVYILITQEHNQNIGNLKIGNKIFIYSIDEFFTYGVPPPFFSMKSRVI